MRKNIILLLLSIYLFALAGCSSKVEPVKQMLTKEAVMGEWETTKIYYDMKSNYPELSDSFNKYLSAPQLYFHPIVSMTSSYKTDGTFLETYHYGSLSGDGHSSTKEGTYEVIDGTLFRTNIYNVEGEITTSSQYDALVSDMTQTTYRIVESEMAEHAVVQNMECWTTAENIVLPTDFEIDLSKSVWINEFRRVK